MRDPTLPGVLYIEALPERWTDSPSHHEALGNLIETGEFGVVTSGVIEMLVDDAAFPLHTEAAVFGLSA